MLKFKAFGKEVRMDKMVKTAQLFKDNGQYKVMSFVAVNGRAFLIHGGAWRVEVLDM